MIEMGFDYFYGQQADQFTLYRVPKVLFTDDRFWNVSSEAKLMKEVSQIWRWNFD